MAGREHVGSEFPSGLQEVAELDRAIALDAGDRRLAREIAVGEAIDHRLSEAGLVVEHVMRNADRLGHAARVVDVLAGAARALAVHRRAMVVELERDADDVVALPLQQGGDHGGIDAAGHGDDDTRLGRLGRQIE